MNRDEIDEAHNISSIVFVLEWLVDKILDDDLEQDVGDDWQKQQKHVLELVDEDEGRESYSQSEAEYHEAEPYFEQQAVYVMLSWVETR